MAAWNKNKSDIVTVTITAPMKKFCILAALCSFALRFMRLNRNGYLVRLNGYSSCLIVDRFSIIVFLVLVGVMRLA